MKLPRIASVFVVLGMVVTTAPSLAQSTPTGAGQQVNPGTNSGTVGEAAKFGMNNGGSPSDGSGLHGGKTVDTYKGQREKEQATNPGLKK